MGHAGGGADGTPRRPRADAEPARSAALSRRKAIGLIAAGIAALVAAVLAVLRLLGRPRPDPVPSPTAPGGGGLVLLDVAAPDGTVLDLAGLLTVQTNGAGQELRDDALLDATTLELVELAPLKRHAEATAALELPATPVCLTLSWPTGHGYSALFADLPGPGHYALAELAARGLHTAQEDIQAQLRQTADSTRVGTIDALRNRTAQALQDCEAAATHAERAVLANAALEAATAAQLAQDDTAALLGPDDAMLGVTFTAPPAPGDSDLAVDRLAGAGRRPLVRIVVEDADDREEIGRWRRCVDELHRAGALVMVQACDSQALTDYDEAAWEQRISALITAFPDADAWETGNELAGEWTGPHAVERTVQAARALAADPATAAAPRVLTLYYQLGQGTQEESVISWAATNLGEELTGLTDVVGLSVYPQWHPLGAGARRVLEALGRVAGDLPVALTELGYGAEDLDDGPWWFGSATDTGAGREAVARHLTAVALGQPRAWAAPLWWYYLQDEGLLPAGAHASQDGVAGIAQELVDAARAKAE
ncbi:Tat pathway signal sequence [Actinomyces procaprae]|uniref:Tat pathway signal sequence n=1 Tax=Actinomyces procaprae TaxID=2560010 RepID=UPI0010A2A53A|nr:Tat pathway signal sequence [Actinomyces procaprae]